ncbi:MAG: sigma-54 factor interaction domain-containing protein, partial [Mucilaginibacter sp.]|nr:sigma-54 factor interaction domain-containing protein [Mucilaginibacter sp.]
MIVIDVEQEVHRDDCPLYLRVIKTKNVKKVLAFPVHIMNEMKGIFFANFNSVLEVEKHTVQSLCAQLAIAVSNLIATEKLKEQLTEINRYKEILEEERVYLKEEIQTANNYGEMLGVSDEMKEVFTQISQVSSADITVLILGETGTGKELVARAIHQHSKRNGKLMVKLNCAAIPTNLIESELFGHERGSFTGAIDRRIGKFELANGGTLFLDEIGELPVELQSKLLRVLQEREIERIGGHRSIPVDVRIIAATNRDLQEEVANGR